MLIPVIPNAAETDPVFQAWDKSTGISITESQISDLQSYLTSVTPHDLLSTTHSDTLAGSVASGDILYGNTTPKWARLAKGTDGKFLKLVSGLPSWESIPAGVSFGTDNQIPFMNAGGTDFEYSANLTYDGNKLTIASQAATGLSLSRTHSSRVANAININTIESYTWSGAGTNIRPMQLSITDGRTITSGSDAIIGMRFAPTRNSLCHVTTANTSMSAYALIAQDIANYDYVGGNSTYTLYGNNQTLQFDPTVVIGANTLTVTITGSDVNYLTTGGTLTSGTLIVDNYGFRVRGTGSTLGTRTFYAFRNDAAGFDVRYCLYNNTADPSLMGLDNAATYFGTGLDAFISYDGTNWNFDLAQATTAIRFNQTLFDTDFEIYGDTALLLKCDAGNQRVGLNTSAPDRVLEINAADGYALRLTYNDSDGSATNFVDIATSSTGDLFLEPSGGDVTLAIDNGRMFFGAGFDSYMTYNGTHMVIDPDAVGSGGLCVLGRFLGLGTTDIEAWGSGFQAIEFPKSAFMIGEASHFIGMLSNVYWNGANWTYKSTDTAGMYRATGGNHRWYVAASGTVDTTITGFADPVFSILVDGNVGIGVTTPLSKLAVNGDISIVDGMTAPATTAGHAKIYVDSADGDLKIKFGDGTVKTIVTDT